MNKPKNARDKSRTSQDTHTHTPIERMSIEMRKKSVSWMSSNGSNIWPLVKYTHSHSNTRNIVKEKTQQKII